MTNIDIDNLSAIVAKERGRAVAAGEEDWWHGLNDGADLNVWLDLNDGVWHWTVYPVVDGRTDPWCTLASGLV